MKKISILMVTCILALLITFVFAEIFSLYHFGAMPTIMTLLYLITLFCIFEYVILIMIYIIRKKKNNEKIEIEKFMSMILLFLSLLMILVFLIILDVDWLNWYAYSTPFYINVIVRSLEFLLPSVTFIVISIVLLKKKR